MRHLTEGILRRMYDDPHSVDEDARRHFAGCEACQERFARVADDARQARALLDTPGVTVDAQAAFARLRPRLRERPAWSLPGLALRPGFGWRKPAAAAAVAMGMAAVMAFTPLADSLQKLFQPQQVQPITLSTTDVNSLQPLASYGNVRWQVKPQVTQVASAAEAAKQSALPELRPGALPQNIARGQTSYETVNASTASFTFSEARARAAAQQAGKAAPGFPAGVDGSSLVVQSGPGEAVVYGDLAAARQLKGQNPQQAVQQLGPMLAVGEMKAPAVYSTGISLGQLKQVLLSQPGLTPEARAVISSLDNPTPTLPIPVPIDQFSGHAVTVQGVQGTALGDNTGLGAAVVWIKHGVLYFVGGTVSQDQALAVANTLG